MTPFYFSDASRRLFGVWQPAGDDRQERRAVLLCNPFGQAAIRAHRLFRVLAARLNRLGVSTLRFDWYGTGDSAGDDTDVEMDGWRRDVRQAHHELVRRMGAGSITWLGAGLGGSVAMQACDTACRPSQLVLWNPVIDGEAYLQELKVRHVATLEATFGLPDGHLREWLHDPAVARDEAMGFAITAMLREQIASLNLKGVSLPAGTRLRVIAHLGDQGSRQLVETRERQGQPAELAVLAEPFDWHTDQLHGPSLVPSTVLKGLLAAVTA